MTDDLVRFLRDRLDEDEASSRAATPGPWKQSGIGEYGWGVAFSRPGSGVEADDSDQGRADAEHIARHDPTRVLAEVASKRRVLDFYDAARFDEVRNAVGVDSQDGAISAATAAVQGLAAVYADHPDYNQAWRP